MNPFDIWSLKFFGNTTEAYLWFFGILLSGLILKRFLSRILTKLLYAIFKKYGKKVGADEFLKLMNRPIQFFILVLIIYFAFDRLVFPREWNLVPDNQFGFRLVLFRIFEASIIFSLIWILIRAIDFIGLIFIARAHKANVVTDAQVVPFIREAIKLMVIGIGFFIVMGIIFNLDVISLVTGLGIGGLAFALAAKETLENLLGSFTIFLDKPFVVGDVVKVGNFEGKVESIGFRSTRIRAVERMIVVVPNKKMTDAELINETERSSRRSSFTIGLTYTTSEKQMKSIISEIRKWLDANSLIEPSPIVRFRTFNSSSMDIQITFFSMTPQIEDFLKLQEEVNFAIMNIVKENEADFAFPTSFVYLKKEENSDID